jgi:peptidyl-prolyl cis-trans isomerase D
VDQERERVFQGLIENKLLEHEMDRLGITVTDEEIFDMVMGEEPHAIIKVYFGDGQGGVNRALLQNFIDNPEARADWIQIEDYLRSERRREKMENLIAATVRVTDQDVLDEYNKRSRTVDAHWVGLRFAELPDDSVQVSDSDLRRFYDAHKDEDFKREKTYSIQYVTLSKQPAPEDSARVLDDLTRLRPRFAEATDDSVFITRNGSERPYASTWFSPDDLDPAVATEVFKEAPAPGKIVGPFFAGTEAHLIKVQAVQPAGELAVRASHVHLRASNDDAEVARRAQEIKDRIQRGEITFEQAMAQYSESNSDLGWFGPGDMVAPFQEAAFSAPVGQVVGPVHTEFGYHLIKVYARAEQEVKIADYAQRVRTDVGTLGARQEQLEDLRYYAEENGDLEAEAKRLGLTVQQVEVEAEQEFIPGIGNSRTLLNFLAQADEGETSPIIELNDDFLLARLTGVTDAGYRPFDDVKEELAPRARNEKKAEILRARMERALQQGGFDGLAQALGQEVRNASDVGFNTNAIPLLGREPTFTGTVLGLKQGQASGVITGENAVFVVKVTNVREPAALTDETRNQLRQQLLSQRKTTLRNQWLAELRQNADVVDNRSKFQQ